MSHPSKLFIDLMLGEMMADIIKKERHVPSNIGGEKNEVSPASKQRGKEK
jgi:hypothetical protein